MSKSTSLLRVALIFLALAGTTGFAGAQVIFVDTANDVIDFGGAQQFGDLPGPDGRISLPEAGLASDNTSGVQTIGFHIPQSEWDYQWLFPGRAVLRPFLGFRVFDTAILDGTTQTAFTGDTNSAGGEVVIWQSTYLINNVGGAVYGLDNSSLYISGGSGNVIQGNTNTGIEVFDSRFNLIGGTNPGEGNVGGFVIQIDRASDNVVVGNTVSRVRVLGWIGGGQAAANNRIGGPAPGERNNIIGFGTWNSEGWPSGYAVQLFDAIGTTIENNQIGTTVDGMEQGHLATTAGIYFDGEHHDTLIRNNRIAGILGVRIGTYPGLLGTAISVYGSGDNVTIVGNKIGLDANDLPRLGSITGITTSNYYLGPVQNVVIGGVVPGEGNEIAGHLGTGIVVANTYAGVRISGNSIHDNGTLGIDLVTQGYQYGVTPNDPGDLDLGGNGLQNFPVLTGAFSGSGSSTVQGTLDSAVNRVYTIEIFANASCDSSGFGEGALYLGATSVTTDAAGQGTFSLTAPTAVPAGWVVTATATDELSGDTSEFAACEPVSDGLTLSVSPLRRGQVAVLTAENAFFHERAYFLYSLRGTGSGACPPVLGGLCLDLLPPVVNLGSSLADSVGTAIWILNVPPGAPLRSVYIQAVISRGLGGTSSVKSNPVSTQILP